MGDGDTIQDYFDRAEAKGAIDFHLRIMRNPDGLLDFYIHPQSRDGETGNFTVSGAFVTKIRDGLGAGSQRPTIQLVGSSGGRKRGPQTMTSRAIDMVDKVAEALWGSPVNKRAVKWISVVGHAREAWREDARRAIEAMREPTEAMINAAYKELANPGAHWEAMIDAALANGEIAGETI